MPASETQIIQTPTGQNREVNNTCQQNSNRHRTRNTSEQWSSKCYSTKKANKKHPNCTPRTMIIISEIQKMGMKMSLC